MEPFSAFLEIDFINFVEKKRPEGRWMTMSQAVNNLTARKTASEKISDSFLNLSIAVIAFLAYILLKCEDDTYETPLKYRTMIPFL